MARMALFRSVGRLILSSSDAKPSTNGTAGHKCLRVGRGHDFTSQLQLIRKDSSENQEKECLAWNPVFVASGESTLDFNGLELMHLPLCQLLLSILTAGGI